MGSWGGMRELTGVAYHVTASLAVGEWLDFGCFVERFLLLFRCGFCLFLDYYTYLYVCGIIWICYSKCEGLTDNCWRSIFLPCRFWDQTQFFRLVGKYLLSHLFHS